MSCAFGLILQNNPSPPLVLSRLFTANLSIWWDVKDTVRLSGVFFSQKIRSVEQQYSQVSGERTEVKLGMVEGATWLFC